MTDKDDGSSNEPRNSKKNAPFGPGRTKNVVVETKRKRPVVPKSSVNVAKADPSKRRAGISDEEMNRRKRALQAAKARETEEAERRRKDEATRAEKRRRAGWETEDSNENTGGGNVRPNSDNAAIRQRLGKVKRQKKRLTNYSNSKLNNSLLRAALTDLRFDKETNMVVAIPFNDLGKFAEALEQDRNDLLEAVSEQVTQILASGTPTSMNLNDERLKEKLELYREECERARPNPRMLYRHGSIIRDQLLNPDVRNALNSWDMYSLDGFVDDHTELMRKPLQ